MKPTAGDSRALISQLLKEICELQINIHSFDNHKLLRALPTADRNCGQL